MATPRTARSEVPVRPRPLRATGGRGSFGPLTRGQAAGLEAAVLLLVLSVISRRAPLAIAGSVVAVLLVAGLVLPVRGRTLARWLHRYWRHRRGWRASVVAPVSAVDDDGEPVGLVHDTTVLLRLTGDGASADAWRRVVIRVADGSLSSAQWSERTPPEGGPPERHLAITLAPEGRAARRRLRLARSAVADVPGVQWLDASSAGELLAETSDLVEWSATRTRTGWHSTFWISVWPGDPAGMLAALAGAGTRVSLAVHGGDAATLRFTGLIALSSPDREALGPLGAGLEARARSAGARLVRLDGEQAMAYAAVLPGGAR